MRDAAAMIGARAWVPCPRCDSSATCGACWANENCGEHWCFLLGVEGRFVFLQCGSCRYRWWHDTEFGEGDRPAGVDELDELLGFWANAA